MSLLSRFNVKKSQQYNVLSKNLMLVRVELLDGSTVECTLPSQSTAQQCLVSVCQRAGIGQSELFGLRLEDSGRADDSRWLDLDKPVRRQLRAHATCGARLLLRVMFYIHDMSMLQDCGTRSQYFLQVCRDVVEGRLVVDMSRAISLAAYSQQAQFGDQSVPSSSSASLLSLFPQQLLTSERCCSELQVLDAVSHVHRSLRGLARSTAQLCYIGQVASLPGYGHEKFSCKDEYGEEVVLAVCVTGVLVQRGTCHVSASATLHRWLDISNLHNQRRSVGVELSVGHTAHFLFDDKQLAKYVWKLCVQQHKFFKKYGGGACCHSDNCTCTADTCKLDAVQSSNISENTRDSSQVRPLAVNTATNYVVSPRGRAMSCDISAQLANSSRDQLNRLVPEYRAAPDYNTAIHQVVGRSVCSQLSHNTTCSAISHEPSHSASGTSAECSIQPASTPQLSGPVVADFNDNSSLQAQQHTLNDCTQPDLPQQYCGHVLTYSNSSPELTSSGSCAARDEGAVLNMSGDMDPCRSGNNDKTPTYHHTRCLSTNNNNNTLYNNKTSSSTPDLLLPKGRTGIKRDLAFDGPLNGAHHCGSGRASVDNNLNLHRTFDNLADAVQLTQIGASVEDVSAVYHVAGTSSTTFSQPQPSHETLSLNVSADRPGGGRACWTQSPRAPLPVTPSWCPPTVTSEASSSQCAHMCSPLEDSCSSSTSSSSTTNTLRRRIKQSLLHRHQHRSSNNNNNNNNISTTLTPSSAAIPPHRRREAIEERLNDAAFCDEFERVAWSRENAQFTTAVRADNIARNRCEDVLPYDENRVRVSPSSGNVTGYVNASHVSVSVGNKQRFYVAAQSPLSNTVEDFWRVVWENHVRLVVMLQHEDCFSYWPQRDGATLQLGQFEVIRTASSRGAAHTTCQLHVSRGARRRVVWHLQHDEWPRDGQAPHVSGFIELLHELDCLHAGCTATTDQGDEDGGGPVLVHSRDGAGGSGVVVMCHVLLHCLDHNLPVQPAKLLQHLRQQRTGMVRSLQQYRFIHRVMLQHLGEARLI